MEHLGIVDYQTKIPVATNHPALYLDDQKNTLQTWQQLLNWVREIATNLW